MAAAYMDGYFIFSRAKTGYMPFSSSESDTIYHKKGGYMMERYSIIWQENGQEWLPYFIWGDILTSFEAGEGIEADETNLLKGILYELDAEPKFPIKREILIGLLDELMYIFNYQSLEKMILDVAAHTRDRNGSVPSQIMLEAGNNLMPDSTKIKSDIAYDLAANE